jgi:predicted kinase
VLDASFRGRAERLALADLARRLGVQFRFVECTAPLAVCRERLAKRARGASISDGRAEIFDAFVAAFEPITELPAGAHLRLDTSRPEEVVSAELRAQFT